MPPEAWISLATTNGALLLFVIYLIQDRRIHQKAVQNNHEEWRGWLSKENKSQREWMADQSNIWRSWVEDRDKAHIEAMRRAAEARQDRDRELMLTIKHLDEQVGKSMELLRGVKND